MSLCTFVANRLVYPLGDIVMGTHIVKSLKELERLQWDSPEKIRDRQDELLRKLIAHSYKNVPYWKGVFEKLNKGVKPDE